jgi:hypothetical protein
MVACSAFKMRMKRIPVPGFFRQPACLYDGAIMRACLLLTLAALTACSRAEVPAQHLNVVLITFDALRADSLGYGRAHR